MDTPTPTSPEREAQLSTVDSQAEKRRPYQEKPDNQEKVAADIGLRHSQISEAQRHVTAVERYPERGAMNVPMKEALRLAKVWDAMTPSTRDASAEGLACEASSTARPIRSAW
jgi:hypothetical protein